MDDSPEITLKKLCCTCLSSDRKLFQLCRLNEGVNNLYSLLSHDTEAYREGFYKEAASLFVCWECEALMRRLAQFRRQACVAQRRLASIADGRNDVKNLETCLSRLFYSHKITYDFNIVSENEETDNFIDCGPLVDIIKTEIDDLDDIPLSELHNNYLSDNNNDCHVENNVYTNKNVKRKLKCKTKSKIYSKVKTKIIESCVNSCKDYFVSTQMSEEEMVASRDQRKREAVYTDAKFKCESCIETFKNQISLDRHNTAVHMEKDNHTRCSVCCSFIPSDESQVHNSCHYTRHRCALCEHHAYSVQDIAWHLRKVHTIRNVAVRRKKGIKADSPKRRNAVTLDQPTPDGYPCTECNRCFNNKNQRWKHVQRHHREGFKCSTCGKRFAFKNNLSRHEQVHVGPPPREQCPTCQKLIRVDLLKIHARIHSQRERYTCVECAKSFVSRASYEHHLKYTQAHASRDILKYKCASCDKGYRSRGELRDHVSYRHDGRTRHQCPVCGKALATRRCVTRHVRRAHHGVKEGPRDKICQQCGKAFRDKKGLREHEFTHTGERPLACEVCGCTFRQSASLYTHRKRVHNIYPPRKTVQLIDQPAN